jgi:putative alpha-1,2-mannosidase
VLLLICYYDSRLRLAGRILLPLDTTTNFVRAIALLGTLLFQFGLHAQASDPSRWVVPTIGSANGPIGYGGTMPFVTPPFGMTDWTPQTRQNRLSVVSYNYSDTTMSGFMGTHQPAIWMGDYGYLTIMPEVDSLKLSPDSRALRFAHAVFRIAGCRIASNDKNFDDSH